MLRNKAPSKMASAKSHQNTKSTTTTTKSLLKKKSPKHSTTSRTFSTKGRANPNATRAKAAAVEARQQATILQPNTTPSPAQDALPLDQALKNLSTTTPPTQTNTNNTNKIPEGLENHPQTFKEAMSKDREQPLPFKELDPNSFKAKVGRFFGITPTKPPLSFKAIQICPEQTPQHYFPTDMPGTLVYSIDHPTFQKLTNSDIAPVGTMFASLAALSMANWDMVGSALWVVAALMGGWNLYTKSEQVTRISVETTKERCQYKYPKIPSEQSALKVIKTIHLEQKNFPFSAPKKIKIEVPETLERLEDPSFAKEFVEMQDLREAVDNPAQFFVSLSVGKKHHMLLHLDQIRNLPYINQILTRASKPLNNMPTTKM